MDTIPEENYSVDWSGDRPKMPRTASERETLTSVLDWHRHTFELKCQGLTPEQMALRSVDPSTLSLHGLLRQLTGVERWWFRIQFAGEDVPMLYYSDEWPEQDFDDTGGDVEAAWAAWREECARSREIVAAASLDDVGKSRRDGEPFSLRWLLANHIAEYARHDGHADLLRERIDGRTGR
ncbi:DinB family protein [Amycolatopsis sp. cmx-11-51]|uniref:DinB family protein n=1 Tax=Amycolatopsis sp. cmx-11-51 TaxID=2785797 RepID=UPI0039E2B5F1